ncbi:MAG TPA: DUF493 domain-containing protein [Myxococcota bacterium]|jgi:hypothetical protein
MSQDSSSDTAGPLLGWSLAAMEEAKKRIHDLVQFPCEFCFKAVGPAVDDFKDGMLARVAEVLGRALVDDEHSSRKSAQGTYQSITLKLWMTSGDQVYAVYAALGADERVKYLL